MTHTTTATTIVPQSHTWTAEERIQARRDCIASLRQPTPEPAFRCGNYSEDAVRFMLDRADMLEAELEAELPPEPVTFGGITLLDPTDSAEHYNTQTIANGRTLKAAADVAAVDFMATLDAETRAELAGYEHEYADAYEFLEEAANAKYAEYQLEADQTMSQFADYSIFNVCREAGHKLVSDGRYMDGYHTAHITAYNQEKRTQAFVASSARKLKARRYHDIADLCLNSAGRPLAISRQAMAYHKAKAQAFKVATSHLKNAKAQRVRRYMATHQCDVQTALATL